VREPVARVALCSVVTRPSETKVDVITPNPVPIVPAKQILDRFNLDSVCFPLATPFLTFQVKRKRKKKIKKHLYKKRMRKMKALLRRIGKIR
jgi:hypothetical protein